jgi:hypothetical protein
MNRIALRVTAPLFAAATLACGGERAAPAAADLSIDPTPVLSIGVEEGEEPYQLLRVLDAMIAADGRIVISNSGTNELRLFDPAGRYLGALGRRGAGPMEFNEVSGGSLYANATQVLAADEAAMRVHVLAPDLTFRETRRFAITPETPRPVLRGLASTGEWIAQAFVNGGRLEGQPGQVLESSYHLLRYDSTGALLDTIVTLPARLRVVNEYQGSVHFPFVPLAAEPQVAVDGDRVIVVGGSAPVMQVYALDGRVILEQAWNRERVRTATLWDEFKRQSAVAMAGQRDSARYAEFHSKALPLPEYAPLYVAAKADGTGRIWLERFRMPLDSARRWDVLDRDGRLLGTVDAPRGVSVLRFSGDRMIGRARDSLGVERVQLFRVNTGGR